MYSKDVYRFRLGDGFSELDNECFFICLLMLFTSILPNSALATGFFRARRQNFFHLRTDDLHVKLTRLFRTDDLHVKLTRLF